MNNNINNINNVENQNAVNLALVPSENAEQRQPSRRALRRARRRELRAKLETGASTLDLRLQALKNAMRALDRSAGDVALETFANCLTWIAGFAGALAEEARALETEIGELNRK